MSISTKIGSSTRTQIFVRGHDLVEDLIGHRDFVQVAFLQMMGRFPTVEEANVVNALLVTVADHGLTPSVMSARLTNYGSPDALQSAVAAGLLGAGNAILGAMQNVAELLQREVAARALSEESDLDAAAASIVDSIIAKGERVPGVGHPIHLDGDPRVPRLFAVARANGFYGIHCKLAEGLAQASSKRAGREFPLNAAAAIGAIVVDIGLPPLLARGLALIARAAGLVAHILEEHQSPIARELWAAADPSVVPSKKRQAP